MKKVIASIALIATAFPFSALATPSDVSTGEWYFDTVNSFVQEGFINDNQPFRPTHNATRGELVQMIVTMLGGPVHAPYSGQSFDDVPSSSSLYEAFEEAGVSGWLKGKDNCYGKHPCTASPNAPINRAEAAALIIRAFGLNESSNAPEFTDNAQNEWYHGIIKTAASLCILRGDSGKPHVRPANSMIRAEMVVMLERSRENKSFPNCDTAKSSTKPTESNSPDDQAISLREKATKWKKDFYKNLAIVDTLSPKVGLDYLEALTAFGTFLTTTEKLADIAENRKLSSEEKVAAIKAVEGINQSYIAMINILQKAEGEKTSALQKPDPLYPTLFDLSKKYTEAIATSIPKTRAYDYGTAMRLLDVLDGMSDQVAAFDDYVKIAKDRPLTATEWQLYKNTVDRIERSFSLFLSIQQEALDSKKTFSPESNYIVPVPTQPTVDCQALRNKLGRELGKLGLNTDQSALNWMYSQLRDAGCSSLVPN